MSGCQQTHPIRFRFHAPILHHGDARSERIADATRTLLHDVCQFVS
jgi:hypothetical protein